jgi:hypothetical protein
MSPEEGAAGLFEPELAPDQAPHCGCGAPLRRTVLDTNLDLTVEACLRCGQTIGYLHSVDWSHPHDVRLIAVTPLRMETEIGRWIASWPRLAGPTRMPAGRDSVWLSADARADDEADLARLEAGNSAPQHAQPLAERLRRAGAPAASPPAALPDVLEGWGAVHRAMAFSSASPFVDLLMATWSSSRLAGWIAADALTARDDRAERLGAAIAGGDPLRRLRAMRYLAEAPLPTNEIAGLVVLECRNMLTAVDGLAASGIRTVPPDLDHNFDAFAAVLPRVAAEKPVAAALHDLGRTIADVHQRLLHVPAQWRKVINRLLGDRPPHGGVQRERRRS